LPFQLVDPAVEVAPRCPFIGVGPQPVQAFLQQIGLHHSAVMPEQFIQHLPLVAVQVEPAGQQQPPLPLDEASLLPAFAIKLGAPHFVHRLIGVLHDMELVEDDLALRQPLQNALGEGLPHIHARRLDQAPLHRA